MLCALFPRKRVQPPENKMIEDGFMTPSKRVYQESHADLMMVNKHDFEMSLSEIKPQTKPISARKKTSRAKKQGSASKSHAAKKTVKKESNARKD